MAAEDFLPLPCVLEAGVGPRVAEVLVGGFVASMVWVQMLACGGRDVEDRGETTLSLPLVDAAWVAAPAYVRGIGLGVWVSAS